MDDRVFVSYAREDGAFVRQLASKLKALGVAVWLDEWDLAPGSDWDRSIDQALTDCSRFLIVLSTASVASNEVRAELRSALDLQKPIVPVLREPCDLPRQLKTVQFIDATAPGMDAEAVARRAVEILTAPVAVAQHVPQDAVAPAGASAAVAHGEVPSFSLPAHVTAARAYLDRTTTDLLLQLGEAESRFDWDTAIELGERILRLTVEHPSASARTAAACRCRGAAREAARRDQDALSDYARALDLEPADAETWHRRGVLHRRLSKGEATSSHMRAAIEAFRSASRLWRAGQRLPAAAMVDIERARAEAHLEALALAFALPAMGAVVLSMWIAASEIGFVARLAWLAGAGITGGLAAAAAHWAPRSSWGLKGERTLTTGLVVIGGLAGVATAYLAPPLPQGELRPFAIDLFLAVPAVCAPFVVLVAWTWRRGP